MARSISRRRFTRGLGRALAVGVASSAFILAGDAEAAIEVAAESRVSMDMARVGDPVRLTMVFKVRGGPVPANIPWPEALADNFTVSNVSRQNRTSRSIFGGPKAAVHSLEVKATITPLRTGTFELPFAIEIEGQRVDSNVPVLEVIGADEVLPGPPPGSVPTERRGPVFPWALVDKDEVYVGEQITYDLQVYEERSFLGIHLRKPPSFTDFFTEELDGRESETRRVDDVEYDVRSAMRRALFPQRAGTLEIGAAELSIAGRQRLLSPVLQVEVKPLPAEGRPAGFSANNVGHYAIEAAVDKSKLAANEPATLKVTIEGEGNIKLVDPGTWPELEGFRRYEPKVSTRVRKGARLGGARSYEFLLIPEHGGELTIPSHEFAYFDPKEGRYEVAKTEPIVLTVAGGEAPEPEPEPEAEPGAEEIADMLLSDELPRHTPRERWLTPTRWAYGMAAVPIVAAAGLGGAALWRRFGPDEQMQARARRRQRHRELIDAAESAVGGGEGFHAALAKLLHELAVDRAGNAGVGLPRPELLRLLNQQGVPAEDVERVRDLLDRCDAARFGAQGDSREDRQALFDEVLDLMRTSRIAKEGS